LSNEYSYSYIHVSRILYDYEFTQLKGNTMLLARVTFHENMLNDISTGLGL